MFESLIAFVLGIIVIVTFTWRLFVWAFGKHKEREKYHSSVHIPPKEWFNPFWLIAFIITYPRIRHRRRKREEYIEEHKHEIEKFETRLDTQNFLYSMDVVRRETERRWEEQQQKHGLDLWMS